MSASELVKRAVWVRAGGRCVICNQYLLLDHLDDTNAVRQIGEVAHVAAESEAGPRGASAVKVADRNEADNLILLCPNDHRGADKKRLSDPQYTEVYLLDLKARHESVVEHATSLRDARRTAVLRLVGGIRGAAGNVSREEAAAAVMAHASRMPVHQPDPGGVGGQIDLSGLLDRGDDADADYWAAGLIHINKGVARLQRAIAEERADHVSVFAIALTPLLVALGNRLDDTVTVDVYDRHRSTDSWAWNDTADAVTFGLATAPEVPAGIDEAVLIVNASGTVHLHELPENIRCLPIFTIAPVDGITPSTNTFENRATLASFDKALLGFFAGLETHAHTKAIRRFHLIAAVPVSAAFTIGRRLAVDNAAPHLALYHRTDHSYTHAFDIPTA